MESYTPDIGIRNKCEQVLLKLPIVFIDLIIIPARRVDDVFRFPKNQSQVFMRLVFIYNIAKVNFLIWLVFKIADN